MTPTRFRACVHIIGWSLRQLAELLDVDPRQVRRWAAGATIPQPIAEWLECLAGFHVSHPPPSKKAPAPRG